MNQVTQKTEPGNTDASRGGVAASDAPSPSRRRLIKLGAAAVPVVATLASRPALAWQCQSPSAWGSEAMDPTTSLKNNAGHQYYNDETWTIHNWAYNEIRSQVSPTVKPWKKLFTLYPALKLDPAGTSTANSLTVTVLMLKQQIPGLVCGAGDTMKAVDVLKNGGFHASTLTAQLNFKCLEAVLSKCLPFSALTQMASGSYSPAGLGTVWTRDNGKIVEYLFNNYLARPV